MAFHETLLCRHPERNRFDNRREATMSTYVRARSSSCKDSVIPPRKVDFVKDGTPYCIETKIDENTIFYFPNGDNSNYMENHTTENAN